MKIPRKILIIIQRSNGDVFLSSSLIKALHEYYGSPKIDLLINDDTISIAKEIPLINKIHLFSYSQKQNKRWDQEKKIIFKIFKRYDLSRNLTSSDRSVLYALLAGKKTISAVEMNWKKSWWKKFLLTHYYYFDKNKHILVNNLQPLKLLNINFKNFHYPIDVPENVVLKVKRMLDRFSIRNFIIFHPSAQYQYKVYPKHLRDILLSNLSNLGITIIVTGGNNSIDKEIKKQLPSIPNIVDFIGETSIIEFFALSKLSLGYIGMDTLNMHVAASQSKAIFAIFGPTNLKMWSPWSNELGDSAKINIPIQTYGNSTIFQANMSCVACGRAGCFDDNGISDCLHHIDPTVIYDKVKEYYEKNQL